MRTFSHVPFKKTRALLVFALLPMLLAACGGGGGSSGGSSGSSSSGGTTAPAPVRGTAAVGAPLANATITVLGANGNVATTTADNEGNYTFPAGPTAPVLLKAVGEAGSKNFTLYSAWGELPTANTQININPLTDVMLRQAFGGSANIENKFSNHNPLTETESQNLGMAAASLGSQLAPMVINTGLMTMEQFGLDANPFIGKMRADKTDPLDVLLESFLIRCADTACATYDIHAKFDTSYSQHIDPHNPTSVAPDLSTASKTIFDLFKTALPKLDTYVQSLTPSGSGAVVLGCDPSQQNLTCEIGYNTSTGNVTTWVAYNPTNNTWSSAQGTYTNAIHGQF